jgi:hypothetical protein
MRSHTIGDNYLDEEIKTVSAQANGDFNAAVKGTAPSWLYNSSDGDLLAVDVTRLSIVVRDPAPPDGGL